jgi:hypothetical protein
VGCDKAWYPQGKGFVLVGYLELAFNYVELVSDPRNYFQLFFEFNHWMTKTAKGLPNATYAFDLEEANFHDAKPGSTEFVDGYTLSVWIRTSESPDQARAVAEWGNALCLLVDFLEPRTTAPNLTPIYSPGKPYADI